MNTNELLTSLYNCIANNTEDVISLNTGYNEIQISKISPKTFNKIKNFIETNRCENKFKIDFALRKTIYEGGKVNNKANASYALALYDFVAYKQVKDVAKNNIVSFFTNSYFFDYWYKVECLSHADIEKFLTREVNKRHLQFIDIVNKVLDEDHCYFNDNTEIYKKYFAMLKKLNKNNNDFLAVKKDEEILNYIQINVGNPFDLVIDVFEGTCEVFIGTFS